MAGLKTSEEDHPFNTLPVIFSLQFCFRGLLRGQYEVLEYGFELTSDFGASCIKLGVAAKYGDRHRTPDKGFGVICAVIAKAPDEAPSESGLGIIQILGIKGAKQETIVSASVIPNGLMIKELLYMNLFELDMTTLLGKLSGWKEIRPQFKPLSVKLGPEILRNIFDGIQRPLKTIAKISADAYIPCGVSVPTVDKDILWEFQPKKIEEGDLLTSGDLYADVFENSLIQHYVTLPPGVMGKISYIAPSGQYSLKITVLKLEFQGVKKQFTILQTCPVHTPRPVASKLVADTLLLTRYLGAKCHKMCQWKSSLTS